MWHLPAPCGVYATLWSGHPVVLMKWPDSVDTPVALVCGTFPFPKCSCSFLQWYGAPVYFYYWRMCSTSLNCLACPNWRKKKKRQRLPFNKRTTVCRTTWKVTEQAHWRHPSWSLPTYFSACFRLILVTVNIHCDTRQLSRLKKY